MWILVNCKDPIHGPGHDEERRIIFFGNSVTASKTTPTARQTTALIASPFNGTLLLTKGMEVHPHTPGEDGYRCPICYEDIAPSKLQGRGCGEIVIDDNIDNPPKKKKKKPSDYTACGTYGPDTTPEPSTPQDEKTIKKATHKLREEFEYMAKRKMFNMRRNKIGKYLTPDTFCLWAGYWECAVKVGIIPDKIEYVNEG